MLKKFAEELKETRVKSGISLQEIHSKTKVDIKYLEAIETGNFEIMPEVYIKAFMKSYAATIGMDANSVIAKYEAAKAGKIIEEQKQQAQTVHPSPVPEKPASYVSETAHTPEHPDSQVKTAKNNTALYIGIFAIVLFAAAIYYFWFKSPSKEIITEKPYEEIIEENKKRFETQDDQNMADTSAADSYYSNISDSLVLLIKSAATSWFLVKTDNSQAGNDFILYAGASKQIKAGRDFNITIGNSGQVQFFLNEKKLNFVGKDGEVKNIKIDSTGLKYITIAKTDQTQ